MPFGLIDYWKSKLEGNFEVNIIVTSMVEEYGAEGMDGDPIGRY